MSEVVEFILVFVFSMFLSRFILPRISLVSYRRRLFDSVGGRKLHSQPIPRLGGIAFFPCMAVSVSVVLVFHNLLTGHNLLDFYATTRMSALMASLIMIYLTGMMDDLIGVRYRSKFAVQIVCALLLVSSGFCLNSLHGLFGIEELPQWIAVPFSVLIYVYVMNAINLIDGIDGLASGLSSIALLAFGGMFIYLGLRLYALFALAGVGVLLPFFYYNVFGNPNRGRKIFMGDTGSLTIGLLLATLAIRLGIYHAGVDGKLPGSLIIAFSFLVVPLLDVIRVVLHRVRNGRSPFKPDKNHIHHKFIALGYTQRQALLLIVSMAAGFVALNLSLVHVLSITPLFLLNVGIWTVLHLFITRAIHRRNKAANG